jgi:hypothetical protein
MKKQITERSFSKAVLEILGSFSIALSFVGMLMFNKLTIEVMSREIILIKIELLKGA